MKTAKVTVVPYNREWQAEFEKIKTELTAALGSLALAVEHVGSTAVQGICAKPCIDIDVVIKDYSVFGQVVAKLDSIGYIHEGELGIKDRHAFCYTDKLHLYRHHLYVCPQFSQELHRHITFRDFLCSNPQAAQLYSNTKQTAAQLYPNDIDGYMAHKSPCIEQLYKMCGLD